MFIARQKRRRGFRGLGYDSSDWSMDSAYLKLLAAGPYGAPAAALNVEQVAASQNLPAPLPRPAACSWYDYIWPTQACTDALNAQQYQSVPINAAAAGYPASVVAVAQQSADENTALIPVDDASVYGAYAPTAATAIPFWAWVAGAAVLVLAVTRR